MEDAAAATPSGTRGWGSKREQTGFLLPFLSDVADGTDTWFRKVMTTLTACSGPGATRAVTISPTLWSSHTRNFFPDHLFSVGQRVLVAKKGLEITGDEKRADTRQVRGLSCGLNAIFVVAAIRTLESRCMTGGRARINNAPQQTGRSTRMLCPELLALIASAAADEAWPGSRGGGRCLFAAGEYCCCCRSSRGCLPLRTLPSSHHHGAAAPPSKFPMVPPLFGATGFLHRGGSCVASPGVGDEGEPSRWRD
jgi:hypothetical protein